MKKSLPRWLCLLFFAAILLPSLEVYAGKKGVKVGDKIEVNHFIYKITYPYFDNPHSVPDCPVAENGLVAEMINCADEFYMPSNLVIPDYIEADGIRYPVVKAGDYDMFAGGEKIRSIVCGKNLRLIKKIGGSNLSNVTLNQGLKEIGSGAFQNCAIDNISIPSSVEYIGMYSFASNPLYSVIFEKSSDQTSAPLTIERDAFYMFEHNETKIYSITLPARTIKVDQSSFEIPSLEELNVEEGCENFRSDSGVLYKKSMTGDKWIACFYPYAKSAKVYTFPEFLSGGRIGSNFLTNRNKKINAVDFSKLTSPVVIEARAMEFSNSDYTQEVRIEHVDSIYDEGLQYCSTNYYLGEDLKYLERTSFGGTAYPEFNIDPKNTHFKTVDNGDLLQILDDGYKLLIPAVRYNTKYNVPEEVTVLGAKAFYFVTNLQEVTFSKNLREIGADVFYGSRKLLKVNINDAPVEYIDPQAFLSSHGLNNSDWYMSLPEGAVYVGKTLYRWKIKGEINDYNLKVKEGITTLTPYCFSKYITPSIYMTNWTYNMKTVTLPNSLKYIGEGAFKESASLEVVNIPQNVEYIGRYAFFRTTLSDVKIPENVKYIGRGAFQSANAKNITIGEYYTDKTPETIIDYYGFYGNEYAEKLLIGANVKYLGEDSFSRLASKTDPINVEIPASVTEIGKYAFYAARIGLLSIGENVKTIGECAFETNVDKTGDREEDDKYELREVHIKAQEPPMVVTNYDSDEDLTLFSAYTYRHVPLFVPVGTVDKYRNAEGWKQFYRIVNEGDDPGEDPGDEDGVDEVAENPAISLDGSILSISVPENLPVTVMTLDGTVLFTGSGNASVNVPKGIIIVKAGSNASKLIVR